MVRPRRADPGLSGAADARAWRADGMRALLSVAAVVAPLAAAVAITLRPPPHAFIDAAVMGGGAGTILLLRFLRPSIATRTALTMTILFGMGVYLLARAGLAPGIVLLFAVTSVFAALYFGRSMAFVVVGLGGLAFVVVGWFVTRGHLATPSQIADATIYMNWVRVGIVFTLIGTLLASAISFVIGRVEATASALGVAYQQLGQLHQRLEDAKEEERRFLAHELHDELGQNLTGLKLQLQLAARGSSVPGADAVTTIDELIARVRRMSGDLRPPLLDELGLVPALRAFVEAQASLSNVVMKLEADDRAEHGGRLDRAVEITCFRIAQEAITNALRHASARAMHIRVERNVEAGRVALQITDDGRGFDAAGRLPAAASAGHLGVVGMRERVRTHGGTFQLRSAPGAGTTIEVELPA
jgi:signal transduction histidine kinase